jgi:hypothetical protein
MVGIKKTISFISKMNSMRIRDFLLMAITIIAIGVRGLLSQHKISIELEKPDACGIYCRMAIEYGEMISNQSFDSYYFTKSFTSFLAWGVMKIFSLPLMPINANYIIETFSIVYLLISALVWCLLCQKLQVSRMASWIGFSGMFFSQIFLNITPHAQDSPDNAAFLIGIFTLYFYAVRSLIGLLVCLFLTSFIQPQLKLIILPLIFFFDVNREGCNSKIAHHLPRWLYVVKKITINFFGWFEKRKKSELYMLISVFILIFSILSYLSFFVQAPYFGTDYIGVSLLPISIIFQSIFLGFALFKLGFLRAVSFAIQSIFTWGFVKRFIYSAAVIAVTSVVIFMVARGEILSLNSTLLGRLWFAYTFFQQSIGQPAIAVVVHLGFYGPIVAMFCLLWGEIAAEIEKLGSGIVIGVSLAIMLSNGIESRHLVAFLSWFTLFLCMSKKGYSLLLILILAALQFAASRIYAPYSTNYSNENDVYMMIWGPWISPEHYVDYLLIGVLTFILVAFSLAYEKRLNNKFFNIRQRHK